ncbi:MAG TPA: hypothetical protein VFY39_13945 [Gammaproteobacteria bacterium]|nr:hypothetical protein [Gammaproteobacteria bacterium]
MAAAVKLRLRHTLELAAAAAGLAAMSGVSMLIMAIVASALLIVAWLLVVAVVAYVIVRAGVPWPAIGLALAAVHLIIAYFLYRSALRLSRDLTLPALRSVLFPAED